LVQKQNETGRPIHELVEYAVINMPYVPPKKLKR